MSRRRQKPPRPQVAQIPAAPVAGRYATVAPILLLLVVVCLVTANSLSGAFVLDDGSKIVENTDIRQLRELPSKLVYPYQGHAALERNDPSRPLVFLVYGLVYHFFQLDPVPYHAVSALFHFGSAVLVFLLARLLLWHLTGARKRLAPLLVALFFAVTPIQMGTVIYAYGLSDVLSGFLALLSVYLFVRAADPGGLDLGASLAAMALALFTKQSAVVIPVLIAAFDYFIVCRMSGAAMRKRLRFYWGYAALVAAFLCYRLWYFGALGDIEGAGNTQPALAYAFAQPAVILKYLWSSVVPYGLAIDHYLLPNSFGEGMKGLALAVLVSLAAGARYLWKRPTPLNRVVLFAAAFYVVVLAHNNLGLLYATTGRAAEARHEYETALRLDPNCAPAKKNLALLDAVPAGAGDAKTVPADRVPPELLLQLYEQALRRDPGNAQIRQKYDELKRAQAKR